MRLECSGNSADRRRARAKRIPLRKGVTGVVAMMFLVMFGSLAVAMAVVSQGNLRTAETHLRVSRALGAVDTGMEIASSRLTEAASRFVVAKGDITPAYALQLWNGTFANDPVVNILPPPHGRIETVQATSIATALAQHHAADAAGNIADDITLPTPPEGWVVAPPIGLEKDGNGRIVTATQITYVPPDAAGRVLVIVTGYDWDWSRQAWVTRTAQQHFRLSKTIRHAILSPTRVMIGRNVQVNGPLAIRYNSQALDTLDGPPLVVRSDFYGLDPILDAMLDDFYAAVLTHDVDGDNRLRMLHAVESQPLTALNLQDYDGDAAPDGAFQDMTADYIVDEFDLFLKRFDTNNDGKVVLSAALTAGTPHAGMTPEFTLDDALAELIDGGNPDRNGNGRFNGRLVNGVWDYSTFPDNNGDGLRDAADIDHDDIVLGYRDGVIDYKDRYSKVRGSLFFTASRSSWESSSDDFGVQIGNYQRHVQGAIRPGREQRPVTFDATNTEAPPITDESFSAATQALINIGSSGQTFAQQVAANKGAGWTPPTTVESTPFGSPAPADWYERPVYEGIVFKNVTIPMGTNALFINCTFVGATRVEVYTDNTHPSWIYYGEQARNPATGALELVYPPPPAESPAQLDKSFSVPGSPGYETLPDPLIVAVDLNNDGIANDQCLDTKRLSNNIRFHDCLFVGSIVADKPVVFHSVRNKLQFSGATRFTDRHPDYPDDPNYNPDSAHVAEIAKSSMMLPNYSVDIGTNNSPQDQDVRLRGAIIAGVFDARGNTTIDGVLLTTFSPVYGEAPLSLYGEAVGNPANFNVTLGYFGPEDGDHEGIDLSSLTDLNGDGQLDIGWDTARDATGNLIPVAGWDGVHDDAWYDGVPDTDAEIDPGVYVRRAITFNGFGKVELNWDPDLVLPDGLEAPLSVSPIRSTYEEGRFIIPGS